MNSNEPLVLQSYLTGAYLYTNEKIVLKSSENVGSAKASLVPQDLAWKCKCELASRLADYTKNPS